MAQTRYLRHVIVLSWSDVWKLIRSRMIAISATVYPDRVEDVQAGPFVGDGTQAEAWIKTGSRDALPQGWNETKPGTFKQGRSTIRRVS